MPWFTRVVSIKTKLILHIHFTVGISLENAEALTRNAIRRITDPKTEWI
jgi:hypothetical protein